MRNIFVLCVFCFCSIALFGSLEKPSSKKVAVLKQPDLPDPYIDAKIGYFFFTSTLRHIYTQGGLDGQLSGAYPVYKYLRIYGGLEYVRKSGHSLNGDQKTSIRNFPISLGLQPTFTFNFYRPVSVYFTVGPRYVFSWVHNDSTFVSRRMSANNIGGFVNTGFQAKFGKHFIFDFFGEYSYARLNFKSKVANSVGNRVQVGGLTFGGGIGYAF